VGRGNGLDFFTARNGDTKMDKVSVLIKGALLVTPHQKDLHLKKRDILITNGIIQKIGSKIEQKGAEEIRLPQLHISVGWTDLGAGFGEPGYEDRETLEGGRTVAARSGFTQVVLWPDTLPVPDNRGAIRYIQERNQNGLTQLHPLGALSRGGKGQELAELYDMYQAGAIGFYDSSQPIESPSLLKIALQYTQGFGGKVLSMPIDADLRGKGIVNEGKVSTQLGLKGIPALAEASRIARDLQILEYTGGRLHIPGVSTAAGLKLIEQAKKKGLNISCSTSLHHLVETDEALMEFDTRFKVNPPLRTASDRKALLKGLAKGSIDYLQSDHSPRTSEEKKVEFDLAEYGSLALQSVFGMLRQEYEMEVAVEILTRGYRFIDQDLPEIAEGNEANLTFFHPETRSTLKEDDLLSKSRNSMYVGKEHKGKVYGTLRGIHRLIQTAKG
jgi:dihydroorotase